MRWGDEQSYPVTSIQMGHIATNVWDRLENLPFRQLVRALCHAIPGPERWTELILADVLRQKRRSYPGVCAKLMARL